MASKSLTESKIRATRLASKDVRLSDGNGLYLLIKPNNSRWRRIDYTINSIRKTLSLGTYPVTSLTEAREKALELRRQLSEGIDPSSIRKDAKEEQIKIQMERDRSRQGLPPSDSFMAIADEWFNKKMLGMAEAHQKRVYSQLTRDWHY